MIIFSSGSVPVSIAAKVYGKDPSWVRAGIIKGWLPIGYATRNGERVTELNEVDSRKGRINYYVLLRHYTKIQVMYTKEKKYERT